MSNHQNEPSAASPPDYIALIEDYVQSLIPEISELMHKLGANTVDEIPELDKEQPLELYQMFCKYSSEMDTLLTTFLQEQGFPISEVANLSSKIVAEQRETLVCAEYIAAALEYRDFVKLLSDTRALYDLPPIDPHDG